MTPDYKNYPVYKNYPQFAAAKKASGGSDGGQNPSPAEELSEDVKVGIDVPDHQFTVFLRSDTKDCITGINIITMNGQVLEKQSYPAGDQQVKITLPDSNMPSGIYLVQCSTSGGKTYYRKLLVMN